MRSVRIFSFIIVVLLFRSEFDADAESNNLFAQKNHFELSTIRARLQGNLSYYSTNRGTDICVPRVGRISQLAYVS